MLPSDLTLAGSEIHSVRAATEKAICYMFIKNNMYLQVIFKASSTIRLILCRHAHVHTHAHTQTHARADTRGHTETRGQTRTHAD